MFKTFSLALLCGALASCSTVVDTRPTAPVATPVAAFQVKRGLTTIDFSTMTPAQVQKELAYAEADYEVLTTDRNGNLGAVAGTGKVGRGTYYIRSKNTRSGTFQTVNTDQKIICSVGVLVEARLKITSGSFNLSSFNNLAVGFDSRKVSGTVKIQNIGVNSAQLNSDIGRAVGNLSQASLQTAGNVSTSVNQYLNDTATTLVPHIIEASAAPAPTPSAATAAN